MISVSHYSPEPRLIPSPSCPWRCLCVLWSYWSCLSLSDREVLRSGEAQVPRILLLCVRIAQVVNLGSATPSALVAVLVTHVQGLPTMPPGSLHTVLASALWFPGSTFAVALSCAVVPGRAGLSIPCDTQPETDRDSKASLSSLASSERLSQSCANNHLSD